MGTLWSYTTNKLAGIDDTENQPRCIMTTTAQWRKRVHALNWYEQNKQTIITKKYLLKKTHTNTSFVCVDELHTLFDTPFYYHYYINTVYNGIMLIFPTSHYEHSGSIQYVFTNTGVLSLLVCVYTYIYIFNIHE